MKKYLIVIGSAACCRAFYQDYDIILAESIIMAIMLVSFTIISNNFSNDIQQPENTYSRTYVDNIEYVEDEEYINDDEEVEDVEDKNNYPKIPDFDFDKIKTTNNTVYYTKKGDTGCTKNINSQVQKKSDSIITSLCWLDICMCNCSAVVKLFDLREKNFSSSHRDKKYIYKYTENDNIVRLSFYNHRCLLTLLRAITMRLSAISTNISSASRKEFKDVADTDDLEKWISYFDFYNPPLKTFLMMECDSFTGHEANILRTSVRLTETYLVKVFEEKTTALNEGDLQFVNRLSSFCFAFTIFVELLVSGKNLPALKLEPLVV